MAYVIVTVKYSNLSTHINEMKIRQSSNWVGGHKHLAEGNQIYLINSNQNKQGVL